MPQVFSCEHCRKAILESENWQPVGTGRPERRIHTDCYPAYVDALSKPVKSEGDFDVFSRG